MQAMAEINETKEEDHSSHDEMDQLDALWATFRLPVPIASKGKYYDNDGSPTAVDEWLLKVLDLIRLLHTMEQQYAKPPKDQSRARISRRMNSQISLAYSLLAKVERTCPTPQDDAQMAIQENKVEDDGILYPNFPVILHKLRNDTQETCSKIRLWLDRPPSARKQKMSQPDPEERDLIHEIFFAPDPAPTKDEEKEVEEPLDIDELIDDVEDDVDEGADNSANASPSTPVHEQRRQPQLIRKPPAQQEALDPTEFQKQQQELLEQELADMAKRLKDSTKAMNVTLKDQTKELDDMEDLAQKNLDQVTDTAKKVEDRLTKKKGWKKRFATWSLIGTVMGMWVLCFMVMRAVPKRRVGKVNLFGKGGALRVVWDTCKGLLSREKKPTSGREEEMARERERQRQEHIREQMYQNKLKREREEQRRREQHRQEQQQCEILSDGSQICKDSGDEAGRTEAKVRQIAADRKKRRIEENMANAPAVDAVDSVEEEEAEDVKDDKESSVGDEKGQENIDPMGCIPPTEGMHTIQISLDSLSKALEGLEIALNKSSEGTQRLQISSQREKLQSESKKYSAAFEREKNKAMSAFWADRNNRVKARDLGRALGSIPFCERGDSGESSHVKKEMTHEAAKDREERRRLEHERREKFMEEARKEKEAHRKAEEQLEQERKEAEKRDRRERERARLEAEQLEQERVAAEAAEQAEFERLKRVQIEQERMAAEALEQAEKERLEKERLQQEKEEEEANRLAAQQAEAKRLEQERLAKKAEVKRLEIERIERERHLAEQAEVERLEKERLAAEAEQARLEAERLELERLEAEAARQAESERLAQEQIEQERALAEQRKTEKEEARRLAAAQAEAARLEQERLLAEEAERERLAQEEALQAELQRLEQERIDQQRIAEEAKARKITEAKAKAEAGAKDAIELATEIAADNPDFLPADVRFAAGRLKNDLLAHYISAAPEMVDEADRGGWRPIHEAARAGNLAGIQLLISAGCDLSSRTGRSGKGGTALWWAVQRFGEDHDVVQLLRLNGALDAGPTA